MKDLVLQLDLKEPSILEITDFLTFVIQVEWLVIIQLSCHSVTMYSLTCLIF